MSVAASPLEKIIDRAGALYSLPSVAMEVVRLTSQEDVDTKVIKETIEGDPALTAKILRVVNSSMFGLSGEVANLTQALALLGVRPLKLLVLGFSLPDRMFADLAAEHLQRYWTTALTRAVAARTIADEWFQGGSASGDDAFVAALLRDIGLLVLIQELGDPYLAFLDTVVASEEASDGEVMQQLELEKESLGFDHVQLTAALLRSWKLPESLAEAVGGSSESAVPSQLVSSVQLAELVTQLVVSRRISALSELLAEGESLCQLTKLMVNELVELLETTVPALADALRAPILEGGNFQQTLIEAHAQAAVLAEAATTDVESTDDEFSESLLAESHELRLAMRSFLRGEQSGPDAVRVVRAEVGHAPGTDAPRVEVNGAARRRLLQAVSKLAEHCRHDRKDLSLAMVAVAGLSLDPNDQADQERLDNAFAAALETLHYGQAARLTLTNKHMAVLMPGVDRREAITLCQRFTEQLQGPAEDFSDAPAVSAHAGIASIAAVPNRFESERLVEGANRCLLAAQNTSSGAVKSIEVY